MQSISLNSNIRSTSSLNRFRQNNLNKSIVIKSNHHSQKRLLKPQNEKSIDQKYKPGINLINNFANTDKIVSRKIPV